MQHQACTDGKLLHLNYSFLGSWSCIKFPTIRLNVSSRTLLIFVASITSEDGGKFLLSLELCKTKWQVPVADSCEQGNKLLDEVTSWK
jgi:hypothetical protein